MMYNIDLRINFNLQPTQTKLPFEQTSDRKLKLKI